MQIVERSAGDVTVLDLEGTLIYEEGFEQLRDALNRIIGRGDRKLLLNFASVTALDSSGVGLIAAKYVTLRRLDGRLKLCNLHPRSFAVLNITKLLTIFESYDSEAEGLKSFSASSVP